MKFAVAFLLLLLTSELYAQQKQDLTSRDGSLSRPPASLSLSDPFGITPPSSHSISPSARSVSVNTLLIPPKAAKEFDRSQRALLSGDIRASADHLEKAIQVYPNFVQAHNALGLRHIQLGSNEKALAEFQRALAIEPHIALTYQNLSLALLLLGNYSESESAARRSLELDSQRIASRYLLGRALVAQQKLTPEAIRMLQQSEQQFHYATLILAEIFFSQGRTEEVTSSLRRFLAARADQANKDKAQCWLGQLTSAPQLASCAGMSFPPNFE